MLSHGMTLNLFYAKVFSPTVFGSSPAVFETYFSFHKDIYMDCYMQFFLLLLNYALFIHTHIYICTSVNKFYNLQLHIFTLLIIAILLLLNCLVLLLYLYIHFLA